MTEAIERKLHATTSGTRNEAKSPQQSRDSHSFPSESRKMDLF